MTLLDQLTGRFNDIRNVKFQEFADHENRVSQFLSDFYEDFVEDRLPIPGSASELLRKERTLSVPEPSRLMKTSFTTSGAFLDKVIGASYEPESKLSFKRKPITDDHDVPVQRKIKPLLSMADRSLEEKEQKKQTEEQNIEDRSKKIAKDKIIEPNIKKVYQETTRNDEKEMKSNVDEKEESSGEIKKVASVKVHVEQNNGFKNPEVKHHIAKPIVPEKKVESAHILPPQRIPSSNSLASFNDNINQAVLNGILTSNQEKKRPIQEIVKQSKEQAQKVIEKMQKEKNESMKKIRLSASSDLDNFAEEIVENKKEGPFSLSSLPSKIPKATVENADLPDIPSDESSDEETREKRKKNYPDWAKTPALKKTLETQANVDATKVFGRNVPPILLEEVFKEVQ